MFKIGDKVVCIDDSPGSVPSASCVEKGKIYVVQSFEAETSLHWAVIQLVGLEGDWFVHRFRKLSDIQQENREKRKKKGVVGRVGARGFAGGEP
jgi:hypothetical protein